MSYLIRCCVWSVLVCSVSVFGQDYVPGEYRMEFRTDSTSYQQGDQIDLEVWAVQTGGTDQLISALDIPFSWDPEKMELVGGDQTGCPPTISAGFPTQNCIAAINESNPPADGDGYYSVMMQLGVEVPVPVDGLMVATLQFRALSGVNAVASVIGLGFPDELGVVCPDGSGEYGIPLSIYSGTVPGVNMLRDHEPAVFEIGSAPPLSEEDALMLIIIAAAAHCEPDAGRARIAEVRDWIIKQRGL